MDDWFKLAKLDYIPGKFGYKKIAKKYDKSPKTVESRIKRWLAKQAAEASENTTPKSKTAGEKHGQEERKPKVKDCGDHYIVSAGSGERRREIEITKEKLKKIKELYCDDNPLTINHLCRELDIPRRDFYIIKTAFSITHNDVPYIDEEITDENLNNLVDATLERRKAKYFIKLQEKEIGNLKAELAQYRQKDFFIQKIDRLVNDWMVDYIATHQRPEIPKLTPVNSDKLLEISIVDLHLSKLAWEPETGENYDSKIAEARFMYVIHDILQKIRGRQFEKIIFPVGNDFFNFDDDTGSTTKGTRQDNDGRWQKMYLKGTEIIINSLELLSQKARVYAFLVPGNHDYMASFYAVDKIKTYFRNNPNVEVNAEPTTRKYVEFGNILLGFTHCDKEKKRIFGNMQVEARQAWGRTKYAEWHGAHLHSEQVREDSGVIVRNLSSVTGTDAWHYIEGYVGAIAKSQSFIYDKNKGLEEIMYSVVER